jgi:hypothetical protein
MSHRHDYRRRNSELAKAQRKKMEDDRRFWHRVRQHNRALENRVKRYEAAEKRGDTKYTEKYKRWYDGVMLCRMYQGGAGNPPKADTADGWSYSQGKYVS